MTKRTSVFDVVLWLGLFVAVSAHDMSVESEDQRDASNFAAREAVWSGVYYPVQSPGGTEPLPPLLLLATIFVMIQITRPRCGLYVYSARF
jgi:hypothetical protein